MNKPFNSTLHFLISFVLAVGCQKAPNSHPELQVEKNSQLIANVEESKSEKLNLKYEIKSFDDIFEAANQATNLAIEGQKNLKQTTIISSESLAFIKEVYKNKLIDQLSEKSTFVIYNDAVSRFGQNSVHYIKNAYQNDKIGFVVATYTTAIETMMWIHVAPLSTLSITANIVFTIGSALYFKINKDKWTELTQKIRTPLRNFFNDTDETSKTKNLMYDYIANLGLAMPLALARVPLMSMNEIIDQGVTLKLLEMPILLSIIGTASFFAWSEHLGRIDKKTHPIAKFMFQRVSEIRSLLVATFASTAALLNPGSFGLAPWVTLTVVGLAGVTMSMNAKQINEWIETTPLFQRFQKIAQMNSSIKVLRCEQIFAQ